MKVADITTLHSIVIVLITYEVVMLPIENKV
jgi:hypothetical protein